MIGMGENGKYELSKKTCAEIFGGGENGQKSKNL